MNQALTAGDDTPPSNQASGSPQTPGSWQAPEPPPVPLRADSPEALLTIVPHLLGFAPRTSLVVIGTTRSGDRIKVTLRYDLPDPPGAGIAADLAEHAVGVLAAQQLTTLVAVGYGPRPLVDPVAQALLAAAGPAGIDVGDILRVEGRRYWSYLCTEQACCPAAGTPFATDSQAAFVLARAGGQVLADRAAVAARVAPLGGLDAESMRQATRRAERHVHQLLARVRKSSRLGAARRMIAAEGLNAVGSMIGTYRSGGRYATDYQLAWITVALRDLRVRDDAWARMAPEHADAHLRLWTDLTRRAQPGYVAAPASLLAFVAWQSGDGALANVALDRALADDPQYSMAQLLRQVITAGTPPSLARLPMTPEEVAASYDEAEEDPGDDDGHDLDPDIHDPDPASEP
ncbi:MAG TPA: DUF4192 domain-containing protein [Streptosporangiaceae bacterium]|jgi:hypothetical protein